MFYPYCTMNYYHDTEVVHSELRKDNTVLVHFETPDVVLGFKTLDCVIPNYVIVSRVGYTDDEVADLIEFCKNNAACIIEYARVGGFPNA